MEVSKEELEKRKFPRTLMNLPIEYRVLDAPHAHGGMVVNASKSGLLIQSVRDIPIGTKLNIAVLFPKGFELENFEVRAEIIWKEIHWEEAWEGFQYGLKFIQILNKDQNKLKDLLEDEYKSKRF